MVHTLHGHFGSASTQRVRDPHIGSSGRLSARTEQIRPRGPSFPIRRARGKLESLLVRLGLTRHPSKCELEDSTRVVHPGVAVDTMAMRFTVMPHRINKMGSMARKIFAEARHGRGFVSRRRLASFVGWCV